MSNIVPLRAKTQKSSWWFVQVILPFDKNRPRGDPGWRPSMIFFSVDSDIKGIAVFTSWAAAEKFKSEMPTALETKIVELVTQMPLKSWYEVLLGCVGGQHQRLLTMPVYVDPIDSYGKGHRPAFSTLERWFLRHQQSEVPWDFSVVEMIPRANCTICVMQHRDSGLFMACTMKGQHTTRESIANAIEDAYGTTDWRYYTRTDGCYAKARAIEAAERFIDRIKMRD